MLVALVVVWQIYVTVGEGAALHPAQSHQDGGGLVTDWPILFKALLTTLRTTFLALDHRARQRRARWRS